MTLSVFFFVILQKNNALSLLSLFFEQDVEYNRDLYLKISCQKLADTGTRLERLLSSLKTTDFALILWAQKTPFFMPNLDENELNLALKRAEKGEKSAGTTGTC